MNTLCKRLIPVALGVPLATLLATACGSSDSVIGDDSRDTPDGPGADTNALAPADTSTPDSSRSRRARARQVALQTSA